MKLTIAILVMGPFWITSFSNRSHRHPLLRQLNGRNRVRFLCIMIANRIQMRSQWSFIENRGKVRQNAWSSKLSAVWSRAFPSVSTYAADWNSCGRCFEDHVYLNGRLIAREVDRWNGHSSSVSTNEWSNLRLRSKLSSPRDLHARFDKRASFTIAYVVNTFIFAFETLLKCFQT